MKRAWKPLLGLLIVFLVLEILVFAPDTLDLRAPTQSSFDLFDDEGNVVEQQMQGIHLVESSADQKKWEMWSKSAVRMSKNDSMSLKKVKMIFFAEKGDMYTVYSGAGRLLQNRDIVLEDNVKVLSTNGYEFFVDEIKYNAETSHLTSDQAVAMYGPKSKDTGVRLLELTGVGLDADLTDSKIKVLSDIVSKKSFVNKPSISIKSQQAEFSGLHYLSHFINDVVIDSDTLRITGVVAAVGLDPNDKGVRTVLVEGGVKVSDKDKWVTAHQVEADFYKNKFIFKGNPRVVQDDDELTGDEIIFLDGGKKVKVLRAKLNVSKDKVESKD